MSQNLMNTYITRFAHYFMSSRIAVLILAVICGSASFSSLGYAPDQQEYSPQQLQKFFLDEAKRYEIVVEGRETAPLVRPEPLLNWQNAERQGQLGSIFVCTHEGRPEMIISIFTFTSKNGLRHRHELISMSDRSMKVAHDGERVWKPRAAELRGKEIQDIGQPDSTAVRRLNQMRAIMRQMEGQLFTDPPSKLNLLPQPLFRYTCEPKGVIDGAIFAMALGTDPDILVMLEARKSQNGERWFVVPFRSHLIGLELKYRGESIWKAESKPELKTSGPMLMPYASEPFFVFTDTTAIPSQEEMEKMVELKDK